LDAASNCTTSNTGAVDFGGFLDDDRVGVRASEGEDPILPFAPGVHGLHALEGAGGGGRGVEPTLRAEDPLESTVIALDPIVQILHPPALHRPRAPSVSSW